MPYWAIYVSDPELHSRRTGRGWVETGTLDDVVGVAPSLCGLAVDGLGAACFGEDRPDLTRLTWCPRRLSFVERLSAADDPALARRLSLVEARLVRLAEPEPVAVEEPPSAPAGFWARLRERLRGSG